MVVALVVLAVRSTSGWSDSFAVFWYGLWAAAVVLAIVGLVEAAVARDVPSRRRAFAIGLGVTTLALTALLVFWILSVLSAIT